MKSIGITANGPKRDKQLHILSGAFCAGLFAFFGTNGTDPTANADVEGGGLTLTTAGADNDGNFCMTNEFISFNHANEKWSFEWYGKFSATTQIDSFAVVAVRPANDAAILTSIVDGTGYVKVDGTTNISLQCVKNSTDVGVADTGADQGTTEKLIRLEVQTGNTAGIGDVQLYIDNEQVESLRGVQLPEDELLAMIFGSGAGDANAVTSTLYWLAWDCPYPYHL